VNETVYGDLRGSYEALLASLTATSADDPAGFR
jgi:hypothetical protein